MDKTEILKVIVGSQAHGLATPESDTDYRGIYVLPTKEILGIGYKYRGSHWVEGEKEDATAYEIGHFLHLATKCNPTILEVFFAPIIKSTLWGNILRDSFKYVWEPKRCFDAFVGYGNNQRKKMLDKKESRQDKFAIAYIRTLHNLNELLDHGYFTVKVGELFIGDTLKRYRTGDYTFGEVINLSEELIYNAKTLLTKKPDNPDLDLDKVNDLLIDVRKEFFK